MDFPSAVPTNVHKIVSIVHELADGNVGDGDED